MSNGDGMTNFHWLEHSTANGWAWALAGIPATLAWLAAAICWFIEPRLAAERDRLREEVAEARRIADHDKALWLAAEAALATARAETAAMVEAAARTADNHWNSAMAANIRSLTPADATAAAHAIRRKERAQGMREAAAICNSSYGKEITDVHMAILARAEAVEKGATS